MGRWVVRLCVVLALALAGWWWVATQSLQRGILSWMEMRRAEGIEVEAGQITRSGFPLRIAATVSEARLHDPAARATLLLPQVTLSTPVYWPGDASLSVEGAQATFAAVPESPVLTAGNAQAQIALHPGTRLQLEALSGSVAALKLEAAGGRILDIDAVQVAAAQAAAPETYAITMTATGLTPGSVLTDGLRLPSGALPAAFAPITAEMVATFERPWDRTALNTTRPQLRALRVTALEMSYGDVGMSLTADLNVDGQGVPTGSAQFTLNSWQQMFDAVMDTMAAPPDWAPLVRSMLQSMSDGSGALDLEITFAQGQMRAGFLPLGPAPRLIIP